MPPHEDLRERLLDQVLGVVPIARQQPGIARLIEQLGAKGLAGHVERDRDVGRRLVAHDVDQHRGEAVDRVGRLPGGGREVLDREREEGPVGQRVPVEQQQAGGLGVVTHVQEL